MRKPSFKVVYIAHPISEAVRSNVARVEKIVESIMEKRGKYFPFAPYLDACRYLDNDEHEDVKRAFLFNERIFDSGLIDELWVCGTVSRGVQQEIDWAVKRGIDVVFKDYEELVA